MGKVILNLKTEIPVPVEAETISPDIFAAKTNREIKELPVFWGNKIKKLGELFDVEGEKEDNLEIRGQLRNVKKIGQGMSRGKIRIIGNAGMHLGSMMKGGEILVEGDAQDWLGAEMTGGLIRVKGNAGNLVGAAYRGASSGLNGGTIIIEGNAGSMAGELMCRGMLVILGRAGDFTGSMMKGGTIIVFGPNGERLGAQMKRGSLVVFQKPGLLPTFRFNCTMNPVFLRVAFTLLKQLGIQPAGQYVDARFLKYSGDFSESGKGEILVYDQC